MRGFQGPSKGCPWALTPTNEHFVRIVLLFPSHFSFVSALQAYTDQAEGSWANVVRTSSQANTGFHWVSGPRQGRKPFRNPSPRPRERRDMTRPQLGAAFPKQDTKSYDSLLAKFL